MDKPQQETTASLRGVISGITTLPATQQQHEYEEEGEEKDRGRERGETGRKMKERRNEGRKWKVEREKEEGKEERD